MSAATTAKSYKTPNRWGLYLPFIALFLLCAVWSGFWYYTAGRIGDVMDEAFAREYAFGTTLSAHAATDLALGPTPRRGDEQRVLT